MCYNYFVDYIVPPIGLFVSILAFVFTFKTYEKSYDILKVINKERRYNWNRKELENLFSVLSIDSLDSFFGDPNYIRNDLWVGLRAVDLSTFQYEGKEKDTIVKFIQELESFQFLRYEQTPSGHWKLQPLFGEKHFDEEKEMKEIEKIETQVKRLKPVYDEVKEILLKYHIGLREINSTAREFYEKEMEEKFKIMQE